MAIPKGTVWQLDPHTAAKHAILREYLNAWFLILAQSPSISRFTYAEGFAGPGIYEDGEPGSPIVALDVFLDLQERLPRHKHLHVILIEESERRVRILREQVDGTVALWGGLPPTISVEIVHKECVQALVPAVTQSVSRKEPFFAFLDGWGAPDDIPFDMARSIAQRRGGEAMVTFQASHLWRFVDVEQRAQAGDRCFGGPQWREVDHQPSNHKKIFLVNAYRDSLRQAGFDHLTSFEMADEHSHALHLVFGTNSVQGLKRMKDALWRVDPITGERFQDPLLKGQLTLDMSEAADRSPLRHAILQQLEDGPLQLRQLREFALFKTIYRASDARIVVKQLCQEGRVVSSDGLRLTEHAMISLETSPRQSPLF